MKPDFSNKNCFTHFWTKRSQNGPKMNIYIFSLKSAVRIFLIFCMKVGHHKWRKVTEPYFLGKFWVSKKFGEFGPKWCKNRVFNIWENVIIKYFGKCPKMNIISIYHSMHMVTTNFPQTKSRAFRTFQDIFIIFPGHFKLKFQDISRTLDKIWKKFRTFQDINGRNIAESFYNKEIWIPQVNTHEKKITINNTKF